jgi:hypothetical protein
MEKLRVWWIPQVPMEAFMVDVKDLTEAKKILDVLADYDEFQFRNNVRQDHCNTGGLEYLDEEQKEWSEFEDEEGKDIWDTNLVDTTKPLKKIKSENKMEDSDDNCGHAFICENCGKEIDGTYVDRGMFFCNPSCAKEEAEKKAKYFEMLSAMQFGYKQCEKGNNIQMAEEEFRKTYHGLVKEND